MHGARLTLESMLGAMHDLPGPVAGLLEPLCAMFTVEEIERGAAWFLCEGLLDADQVRSIPDVLNTLCDRISPHVTTLLAAFEIPDELLRVPISAGDHSMLDSPADPISDMNVDLPAPRADQPSLAVR
jgi:acyl-CoA oxidase